MEITLKALFTRDEAEYLVETLEEIADTDKDKHWMSQGIANDFRKDFGILRKGETE